MVQTFAKPVTPATDLSIDHFDEDAYREVNFIYVPQMAIGDAPPARTLSSIYEVKQYKGPKQKVPCMGLR